MCGHDDLIIKTNTNWKRTFKETYICIVTVLIYINPTKSINIEVD